MQSFLGCPRHPNMSKMRRVEAAPKEGNALSPIVEDDGAGFPAGVSDGIGLSNTRERLRALYRPAPNLSVTRRDGGGTSVRIDLPLPETTPSTRDSAATLVTLEARR